MSIELHRPVIIRIGFLRRFCSKSNRSRGKRLGVLSATDEGAEETHFLHSLAASVDYFSLKKHDASKLPEGVRPVDEKPESLERTDAGICVVTQQGRHCYDGVFIFRSAVSLGMLLPDLTTDGAFIPVDRGMRISDVRLLEKRGGKSGDFFAS